MTAAVFVLGLVASAHSAPSASPAALAPAETLAFTPTADSRVEKAFTLEHELVLQKLKFEGDDGEQISQRRLSVSSKVSLGAVDTYRSVEGGRPLLLQRLYQEAGMHIELVLTDAQDHKEPDTWSAESPLKNTSVVFTWVPEEKSYGRHCDQKEILEEYLGGLTEDLDLRGFLPEREVHKGDAWTIEANRLVDVFAFGGNVPMAYVKGGSGFFARSVTSGVGGPLSEVFGGEVKGRANAKWTETREETREGSTVRLAVVQLDVEIEAARDKTASAQAAMHREELLDERTIGHASVNWKFKGEGTLTWNLTAGRFESFELGGREDVQNEISLGYGGETTAKQELSVAGSLKLSASVTAKKK